MRTLTAYIYMYIGWTSSNYSEDATMYRLNISYATAATSDTGIYGGTAIGMALAVQIHGVSSMQRAFRYSDLPASPGSGVTFPLNTAIIKIKMGVVEVPFKKYNFCIYFLHCIPLFILEFD